MNSTRPNEISLQLTRVAWILTRLWSRVALWKVKSNYLTLSIVLIVSFIIIRCSMLYIYLLNFFPANSSVATFAQRIIAVFGTYNLFTSEKHKTNYYLYTCT
jgi:CHASE2 domain-containing sensor protein